MIVKTSRLELKIIDESDADAVFETLNYKNTAEIISFFHWPMTMDQAEGWCRMAIKGFKDKTDFMFIARLHDGTTIGCLGLHFSDDPKKMETGYWVSEPMQGQGFASEMLKGAIAHAFDHFKAETVFATTAFDNAPSVKLLEKQGFKLAGTKDVKLPNGSIRVSHLLELKRAA